jgi:transcriptional regulator with XRE-family HTH domain
MLLKTMKHPMIAGMTDHPLTRWRQKHHYTQMQLAERCGIRQGTLARYESGTRIPRGAHLVTLLEVTGLPAEALVLPERFLEKHPDFLRPKHSAGDDQG